MSGTKVVIMVLGIVVVLMLAFLIVAETPATEQATPYLDGYADGINGTYRVYSIGFDQYQTGFIAGKMDAQQCCCGNGSP